jgi:uncharacterized membrane protein
MEIMQFLKFWIRHEYFGLIILNYLRNLVKYVRVSFVFFLTNLQTSFILIFWGILLSLTNCRIFHRRQHQRTNVRIVKKQCTNTKVVAVQFAK